MNRSKRARAIVGSAGGRRSRPRRGQLRARRPPARRPLGAAHEIERAIVARTGASGAARARGFIVTSRFEADLGRLSEGLRHKAIAICVEVCCGLGPELGVRGAHRYRAGAGANGAPLTRPDGAVAWRARLENRCPQARRLHWWSVPGGGVEFVSITSHDDRHPFGAAPPVARSTER